MEVEQNIDTLKYLHISFHYTVLIFYSTLSISWLTTNSPCKIFMALVHYCVAFQPLTTGRWYRDCILYICVWDFESNKLLFFFHLFIIYIYIFPRDYNCRSFCSNLWPVGYTQPMARYIKVIKTYNTNYTSFPRLQWFHAVLFLEAICFTPIFLCCTTVFSWRCAGLTALDLTSR